jgi:toxin-antitoxin system PIN domain toxin
MKLLSDVNVLVALVAERHASHKVVKSWWQALPDAEPMGIVRPVQTGLLRLLSTEAVMGNDTLSLSEAWGVYATLLASGRFTLVLESPGLDVTWEKLCRPFGRSPKVVMDAYLAAFALSGGYRLVTLDRAFTQFPKLDCVFPA